MRYYPAFLNLKGKNVLLFGAGEVALRKAKSLVESGAKLSVISRDFSGAFIRYAKSKNIRLKKGDTIANFRNISLVIAATSSAAFNRAVFKVCERQKIWVNVVDDSKHSSFIVPSLIRRGNLQIAISTGGASPAMAKLLRKKWEGELSVKYAGLLRYFKKQRTKIKETMSDSSDRRKYFYKMVKAKLKKMKNK